MLLLQQINKLINRVGLNLILQYQLIVINEFRERFLREELILEVSVHNVDHEQVNPLGGIELVRPVLSDAVFDKSVGELEDLLQKHVFVDHVELEHVLLEGVVKDVAEDFKDLHVLHETLDAGFDGSA